MGKSKKRIIYKGKNQQIANITRSEAIANVIKMLNNNDKEAISIITLFGLSAEELLEGGASYEVIKGLGNII